MSNCPNCGAPVQMIHSAPGELHYYYLQPTPLKLNLVRLRAIEDYLRIVEQRYRMRPGQSLQKLLREELATVRRLMSEDEAIAV